MIISYNWLSDYLPVRVEPEKLSMILTSIGLEVEAMESFEEIKGSLSGLVIGQVLETEKHPNADKLTLTKVNTGSDQPLQIVCGAPNVAAGQKVVVAPVGTTIHPVSGDPLTMKTAKIRGVESQGMICAEDEIGVGSSHAGIMVLPEDLEPGMAAAEYFRPYSDIIYHIGLTPNRADAMSHWGVARDVCAYLSHHEKKQYRPVLPKQEIKTGDESLPISVHVENKKACPRYSGVCFTGVKVGPSPKWMQERLKAVGLRPINNIVDITNYIQHETGQPLHAFDYDTITGQKIVVGNRPEGSSFTTLDEKERKLSGEDLVIADAQKPMCIAGVFGGIESGVTEKTTRIFLESAFFDPATIRKTSFRHGLRTDAATRFEKGTDISKTVVVLKRASELITQITGARVASDIIDLYPEAGPAKEVNLKFGYLKKLVGKSYHPESIKNILESLGFEILNETPDDMTIRVPFHKRDVSVAADVIEEIIRIDGLDNIEIPTAITITPSIEKNYRAETLKERISNALFGLGFNEMLTNSITNSRYFSEEEMAVSVKMINNLSSELDVLRPAMLPTALEVIAYNQNRKNTDLRFFEFGKTYTSREKGNYNETEFLCIYVNGNMKQAGWKTKPEAADIYYIKGLVEMLMDAFQVSLSFESTADGHLTGTFKNQLIVDIGRSRQEDEKRFDLRQPVYYALVNWDRLIKLTAKQKTAYAEVSKFPPVERDLAMVVPKAMMYEEVEKNVRKLNLRKLQQVRLFDVFESEKLGKDKKSLAVNFTFLDEEKTLTDKEIDGWMNRIMTSLQNELGAEIRKG